MRKPVMEDAVFGYRATGAALLANLSMESGKIRHLGSGGDEDRVMGFPGLTD